MKLVCYIKESHEQLALLVNDTLYDMDVLHPELPSTMNMFLNYWEDYLPLAKAVNESIQQGKISFNKGIPLESASLISPVPLPSACINNFENIAEKEPAYDYGLPDFYFTNHHCVQGPGDVECMPQHLKMLDFEPSIAMVVCAHGRNIAAAEADRYIGGFLIRNSINSRAHIISSHPGNSTTKGRDISIVLGPWLVTPDELEPYIVPAKEGHTGNNYNLVMKCRVNDKQVFETDLSNMTWTFAEILESCSYGAGIQTGDIIARGGAGYYFTSNETLKQNDTSNTERWLQPGDVVELEIEGLGVSTVTINEAS